MDVLPRDSIVTTLPQIVLSILAYPLVARLAARLDRLRLAPVITISQ